MARDPQAAFDWMLDDEADARASEPADAPFSPTPTSPSLTKRQLRARGWTGAAVARFLGAPDETQVGRKGGYRWEAHLFLSERVVAVEATVEWKAWCRERWARGERGKRAARETAQKLVEEMRA